MELFNLISTLIVLRHKLHVSHWYVDGKEFIELHKLFGEQYEKILDYADLLSEALIQRGIGPPIRLEDCVNTSSVEEFDHQLNLTTKNIVEDMYNDFSLLAEITDSLQAFSDIKMYRGLNAILDDFNGYVNKQRWILKNYL